MPGSMIDSFKAPVRPLVAWLRKKAYNVRFDCAVARLQITAGRPIDPGIYLHFALILHRKDSIVRELISHFSGSKDTS